MKRIDLHFVLCVSCALGVKVEYRYYYYYYYKIAHEVQCKQEEKNQKMTELQTTQPRKNHMGNEKRTILLLQI